MRISTCPRRNWIWRLLSIAIVCCLGGDSAWAQGKGGGKGGGGDSGGDPPPVTGVVYARTWDLGSVVEVAADGSSWTDTQIPWTVEPSHDLHGGDRWYTRQVVQGGETNPDSVTERYSLALGDGSRIVWITPPANVSVAPRDVALANLPRWVSIGAEKDAAVSYLGIQYSADGAMASGALYRAHLAWVDDGNGDVIPELVSHEVVAAVDLFVSGVDPETETPIYQTAVAGFDWNRTGDRFVIARQYQSGTAEQYEELWLGDESGSVSPLTDAVGVVRGVRPEWARGGASTIAFETAETVETIDDTGANRAVVAADREAKGTFLHVGTPHWSPDGSSLIFDEGYWKRGLPYNDVYRVPRDGGAPELLLRGFDNLYGLAWRY